MVNMNLLIMYVIKVNNIIVRFHCITYFSNTLNYVLTGDVDYFTGPYSVTFVAGTTVSSLYITIVDDSITEGNEQFYLTINSATVSDDIVFGNLGGAVVTIVDDDSKLIVHYGYLK